MRRTPIWVALLVALVMSLLVAPSPAAAKRVAVDHASFNVVAPWGTPRQNWRLVRSVEAAISNVPKRSARHPRPTILIASFMFDRRGVVTKLIAACRRGVSVRVVLDDDISNPQARRLKRALNRDNLRDRNRDGFADKAPKHGRCGKKLTPKQRKAAASALRLRKAAHRAAVAEAKATVGSKAKGKKARKAKKRARAVLRKAANRQPLSLRARWGADRSYVKVCQGACRGPGINMHSKFFVFSSTGGFRHVIKLSSSNLNAGGALKGWNDMYTIRGRAKLYRAFRRVHREMTHDTRAGDRLVQVRSGPYTVRFFPVARPKKRFVRVEKRVKTARGSKVKLVKKRVKPRDPVLADLSKIRCSTPLGRHKRTKIFVSMFYWKDPRGEAIAKRLLRLARKGCTVQVILGAPSKDISRKIKSAGRRGLIRAYDSRWDLDSDGVFENRTHAKFVLVKGHYGKQKRSYQVMTGSGNWVTGSLVGGDEVSLNIASKRAYKQYVRAWDRIRDHSRMIPRRRR
jgi:phosphatidylserine/phosphatidylglycerophosphate/cardiolipin synthase-like enzyme